MANPLAILTIVFYTHNGTSFDVSSVGEQLDAHRERQPAPARRGGEPGGTVQVLLQALDGLAAHHER